MRYLFLMIAVLNLAACGPSAKERQETAILTCNILAESRGMDAAFRIKEINSARDELGEEKFLETDETIRESVKWGLCKELVLGDPVYEEKLAEKRTAYAAREAEQEDKLSAILVAELGAEKDLISKQLSEAKALISEMRQEISDLTLGGEIDSQANEEVRQTIENQRNRLAAQDEEINFYKGVMVPNAGTKGLRIERLDVSSNAAGKVRYSLLLTQLVDKRGYVQGGVQISLLGQNGGQEEALQLSEQGRDKAEAIKFRFRYFQNIAGEVQLPKGFVPREFMVVAQASEPIAQRLEKTFGWPL